MSWKQTVCRTTVMYNGMLDALLEDGWRVVICTPIGAELEYILEKYENEGE
jgi:hypothetical protein